MEWGNHVKKITTEAVKRWKFLPWHFFALICALSEYTRARKKHTRTTPKTTTRKRNVWIFYALYDAHKELKKKKKLYVPTLILILFCERKNLYLLNKFLRVYKLLLWIDRFFYTLSLFLRMLCPFLQLDELLALHSNFALKWVFNESPLYESEAPTKPHRYTYLIGIAFCRFRSSFDKPNVYY